MALSKWLLKSFSQNHILPKMQENPPSMIQLNFRGKPLAPMMPIAFQSGVVLTLHNLFPTNEGWPFTFDYMGVRWHATLYPQELRSNSDQAETFREFIEANQEYVIGLAEDQAERAAANGDFIKDT